MADETTTRTARLAAPWLVVDVMNVVGSRPDGWWHDRVGATARLVARLRRHARSTGQRITAVVDGDADDRVPDGTADLVEVIHAGRARDAADDRIVQVLVAADGQQATVVTADRELVGRIERLGAGVVGPTSLLALLDDVPTAVEDEPT